MDIVQKKVKKVENAKITELEDKIEKRVKY